MVWTTLELFNLIWEKRPPYWSTAGKAVPLRKLENTNYWEKKSTCVKASASCFTYLFCVTAVTLAFNIIICIHVDIYDGSPLQLVSKQNL